MYKNQLRTINVFYTQNVNVHIIKHVKSMNKQVSNLIKKISGINEINRPKLLSSS